MNCICIETINEKLAEKNTMIDSVFCSDGTETMRIATIKIDKKVRKGPIKLIPTFCPFCGIRLHDDS